MGARAAVRNGGQAVNVASLPGALALGWRRTYPVVLQTEATECGLACLAMVARHHGDQTDLAGLRRRFPVSLKGATLAQLMHTARQLKLGSRPVKLVLDDLGQLRLPCVLHWDFNHFVVLASVGAQHVTVLDPAHGERRLTMADVSRSFTGVALELWPDIGFTAQPPAPPLKLSSLMGKVSGLYRSFAQILLLSLVLEIFALASPFFMQWVIDHVVVGQDRDLLGVLVVGFGLLMLMQQAISAARSWTMMGMGTTLNLQWRANVFGHLLRLPTSYFERRHLGDVVSRFGAVDSIQSTLTASFLGAVLDGLMACATLAMMFIYSPGLAAIPCAAMLLYLLGRYAWYWPLRHATEAEIVHGARQQSHFLETVRGVKTIKLFQRQEERRAAWLGLLVDQINAGLRSQKLRLAYQQLIGLLFGAENLAVVWLGASTVIDGRMSVGALLAFMAYKTQFGGRVGGLIDKYFEFRMLRLQGERLADIVHTAPEVTAGRAPGSVAALDEVSSPVDIELRGLRFGYSEFEPDVLQGVDLRIAAGECVAIIGPSGCGKTTLANLLLGVLQPTAGEIRIGGQPLAQLGLDRLRGMVGTVMQDDVLFAGSIAENIAFFDPEPDMAWIECCAQSAAIGDDIARMPMRYNTLVGDMGSVLSGGQRQRVLLARALYKRPQILLLDEATSHLDLDRERLVNDAVRALALTRIIIAHRPETIASADRVIALQDGRVALDSPVADMFPAMPARPAEQAR
ncbi:MAG: cvaB [Rhodoferax sp.]|nr:cvaB [Rhodoferax sp.]